jgi:hypothetical protein
LSEQKISTDECLLQIKERLIMKQYIPHKTARLKMFSVCEAKTLYAFLLSCTGQGEQQQDGGDILPKTLEQSISYKTCPLSSINK